MSDFLIGQTDFNRTTFVKSKWFKLEIGDNFFRVLPPVHSLAKLGKYAQFYSTHGGFRNKKGNVIKFQCVEKKNNKTKLIETHCAICDTVNERKIQYDNAKKANAPAEKLKAFHEANIMPYQAEKKFYLNVIDAAGEIGLLPVPYKLFMSLDALLKQKQAEGRDLTGVNGAYLNFSKQSRFKGDPQVNYFVSVATEQDPTNPDLSRVKTHTLTPDVIAQMKTKTKDLGALYRSISPAEVASLMAASPEEAVELVERLFGRSDKEEQSQSSSDDSLLPIQGTGGTDILGTTIPGTEAKAVSRVELTPGGVKVSTPEFSPDLLATPSRPAASPVAAFQAPAAAPAASAPSTTMTDEQFEKLFASK